MKEFNEKHIETLFQKVYSNSATESEIREYYSMLSDERTCSFIAELMQSALRDSINIEKDYDRRKAVFERIKGVDIWSNKRARNHRIYRFSFAAASAVVLFGLFFWKGQLRYSPNDRQLPGLQSANSDVKAGVEAAILTVDNGFQIDLAENTSGNFGLHSGTEIKANGDGELVYSYSGRGYHGSQHHSIRTKNGQHYKLRLPDGTKLWMNAGSEVRFLPTLVEGNTRKIFLSGEAYFEVAKDSKSPFVVETNLQSIYVLGTHFNVSAYPDDRKVTTSLLEGKVKISAHGNQYVLIPGQKVISTSTETVLSKTKAEDAVDWQQGEFVLNGIKLSEALKKIARWYDVDVVYLEKGDDQILYGGWISNKQPLSVILKAIEDLGSVRFSLEGRQVIVNNPNR
ncbi:FecR domain-containing protein [Sphingobacterium oryzagri]|uniref:FecR domain-containing protein n=1 Tax=Sphingobacterium oryzagri TaxID=3025669 RepID=A0ABY7WBM7_9SPHI|nr:FecR family protein [Sphingobacterium sp. KACC 22765]WDF67066.1 FecR domain-containing protein [Sphingobacterium sp. KACC 22765]